MVAVLSHFMNTDLSAFYVDIRKDALYCEPYSSAKRQAALETIEQIFRCTCAVAGAAHVLHGRGGLARALSLRGRLRAPGAVPRRPQVAGATRRWPRSGSRSSACAASVTGALEIERAAKKIGSSLEAAPQVFIADADLMAALDGVDLAEVCITSGIEVIDGAAPAGAFTLRRRGGRRRRAEAGATAPSARAPGASPRTSGSDPAFPELSARDAAAVREFDARAGRA